MAPKPGTPKRAHIPRSLEHEANRFLWPTAYELFLKILRDCDAVGFTDAADDGLAALEYIAKAVLESVYIERLRRRRPTTQKEAHRKSGAHGRTRQLLREWDAAYSREKEYLQASPGRLATWIAELDDSLRRGKTILGKNLSHLELEQIRLLRTSYQQRLAALKSGKVETPKTKEIREKLAESFVKSGSYGQPGPAGDNLSYIDNKLKKGRRSVSETHDSEADKKVGVPIFWGYIRF